MRRAALLVGLVAIVAAVPMAACDPPPPPACPQAGQPTTVAYKTVAGVDPNLLSLDVHAPAGEVCDAPVVFWVHGGGYVTGDKANGMANKAAAFNAKGWILVSVNYRLSVPDDPHKAQFPDHFEDVADAVAWVDANIDRYGGDPTRTAILGHSAGADIVSNVVTNPTYLHDAGVDLAEIECAGPLDTEGFDKVSAQGNGEDEQWSNTLGNNPDYLTETSATLLVEPGADLPNTIGVYRGTALRQQIERAYLAELDAAGVATTSIDARGLSHAEVNTRIGAPGDTVMTPPLLAFLADCFAA